MSTIKQAARDEAISKLLDRKGAFALKPGDTIHCILRHVSRSGMSRRISFCVMRKDGPRYLDYQMSQLGIGSRPSTGDGINIGGCGMDMGFHAVYCLSRRLFPDGFKLPKGERGRNGDTSGHDNDGGYALKHRWL